MTFTNMEVRHANFTGLHVLRRDWTFNGMINI